MNQGGWFLLHNLFNSLLYNVHRFLASWQPISQQIKIPA